mgnify:CR=1 FL=1|jgi:hypothetical protein
MQEKDRNLNIAFAQDEENRGGADKEKNDEPGETIPVPPDFEPVAPVEMPPEERNKPPVGEKKRVPKQIV